MDRSPDEGSTGLSGWSTFGHWVEAIELASERRQLVARILPLGGRLVGLEYCGVSMIKSFKTLAEVEQDESYSGVPVGRVTNRIKEARYGGVQLDANSGAHHLHGGRRSWDKRLWHVARRTSTEVELTLRSPHNDQGYPSLVDVTLLYKVVECDLHVSLSVTNAGELETVANMTLHPYFDLSGDNGDRPGEVADYLVHAPAADRILQLTSDGIPTGKVENVEGSRFDLRKEVSLNSRGHLDHYFVTTDDSGTMREQCRLTAPSGLQLQVHSDQHGFQLYTPDGQGSVAVEPSGYVDAPNHNHFPTIALAPGDSMTQRIMYRFS